MELLLLLLPLHPPPSRLRTDRVTTGMGNQVDKLSHLSYAEVPTADLDPEGAPVSARVPGTGTSTGTGRRIGVSYIFSSDDDDPQQEEEDGDDKEEDDSNNKKQEEEQPPYDWRDEVPCAVHNVAAADCVYEKKSVVVAAAAGASIVGGDPEAPRSPESLLRRCRPGDLVEFVSAAQHPHWAVYVGDRRVVHLHRCEVKSAPLTDAARGRRGRIVNRRYRFEPLGADAVVRSALGQVGLSDPQLSWRNSECFAAWCRFGRREFKVGGELRIGKQPYRMTVMLSEDPRHWHSMDFQSLEDVILERRRNDHLGRAAVLQELAGHFNK